LLSWYPVFADVSSNGVLGYTTGEGEYRPKGKTDTTVYYSTYATVWRRQPDGNYKAAFDVGISHDKPSDSDKNWTSPKTVEKSSEANKPIAAGAMSSFFNTAATKGLAKAYKNFAAEDARFLREGKFPIMGKSNAPTEIKKSKIAFGKGATMQSAGDLGYSITTYEMKIGDKITEKGNIVQIWKFVGGRWQIVLDVFAPIPAK
jgi:ketosteroid isomerase-like protein